ncbi:MAG TPA: TIM-barrel domain-containing protein, partial [Spirochaetia bacterium]|nr:TIM-barrel domain-containing protein [Spirochaetia bacterium]
MKLDWVLIKGVLHYIIQPYLNRRVVPLSWEPLGTSTKKPGIISSHRVEFQSQNGSLEVSAITPAIWRVLVRREGDPPYRTWSVVSEQTSPLRLGGEANGSFTIVSGESLETEGLKAVFNPHDSTLEFSFENRVLHSESRSAGRRSGWVSCRKKSPEPELYVGFGEKTGPLFKNGRRLIMWNTDDRAMHPSSDPLYQSCPFQIAVRADGSAHGIFYDNPHYSVFRPGDFGNSPKSFYAAERGPLCYYVLSGPSIKDVLGQFTFLTGRYPMPPRWVLGHHHSRWEEQESAERILSIADSFREHKIPCEVLYLDIGHMNGHRCFTWNPSTFPDPKDLIDQVRARRFKSVVITDPGLKRDPDWSIFREGLSRGAFCRNRNGEVYIGPVWAGPSAFPDYSRSEVREWWGSLFSGYTELGVDGFWNDMNEPSLFTPRCTLPDTVIHSDDQGTLDHRTVHNVYGFLMAKATFEGLCRLRPNRRHFLFTRASYAGIQRYASSWTGDNRSNWNHLKMSIPMLISMGLCGQVIVGADIGGFWWHPTKELMARWVQLGAFYPFCRNHTRQGTPPQEVWYFGKEVERISKFYLELRYSLLPYFYTCLRESCETGLPMMRPLFMEFPQDRGCRRRRVAESQFMIGSSMLIAPVLDPKRRQREVYLPGTCMWYDWWTGLAYEGGSSQLVEAPLDNLPLFARGGSVIPTVPPVEVSEDTETGPLSLVVFPGEATEGRVYLDDGISLDYRKGNFTLLSISG